MRCRNPDCSRQAEPDGRWCGVCNEFYARVRAELEVGHTGSLARQTYGRCKSFDCTDPRNPKTKTGYCIDCERKRGLA
jgi:hypothetical protein